MEVEQLGGILEVPGWVAMDPETAHKVRDILATAFPKIKFVLVVDGRLAAQKAPAHYSFVLLSHTDLLSDEEAGHALKTWRDANECQVFNDPVEMLCAAIL